MNISAMQIKHNVNVVAFCICLDYSNLFRECRRTTMKNQHLIGETIVKEEVSNAGECWKDCEHNKCIAAEFESFGRHGGKCQLYSSVDDIYTHEDPGSEVKMCGKG